MTTIAPTIPPPLEVDAEGSIRVAGTRITLDIIVEAYSAGLSPEKIPLPYPAVSVACAYAAIACYLARRDELKPYFEQRATETRKWQNYWESQPRHAALRQKADAWRQA